MRTRLEIRVLALAHETRGELFTVWGTWHRAAMRLGRLLTARGSTRGKRGRLMRVYQLAETREATDLAARCAWTVCNKSKRATWADVPDVIPTCEGRVCRRCFCAPDDPCTIELEGGCGTASCVPAGVFDFAMCSACQRAA